MLWYMADCTDKCDHVNAFALSFGVYFLSIGSTKSNFLLNHQPFLFSCEHMIIALSILYAYTFNTGCLIKEISVRLGR